MCVRTTIFYHDRYRQLHCQLPFPFTVVGPCGLMPIAAASETPVVNIELHCQHQAGKREGKKQRGEEQNSLPASTYDGGGDTCTVNEGIYITSSPGISTGIVSSLSPSAPALPVAPSPPCIPSPPAWETAKRGGRRRAWSRGDSDCMPAPGRAPPPLFVQFRATRQPRLMHPPRSLRASAPPGSTASVYAEDF